MARLVHFLMQALGGKWQAWLPLLGGKIFVNITFYLHKLGVYSQNQPTFSTSARKYSIKHCNLLLFEENVEILGSCLRTTASTIRKKS